MICLVLDNPGKHTIKGLLMRLAPLVCPLQRNFRVARGKTHWCRFRITRHSAQAAFWIRALLGFTAIFNDLGVNCHEPKWLGFNILGRPHINDKDCEIAPTI